MLRKYLDVPEIQEFAYKMYKYEIIVREYLNVPEIRYTVLMWVYVRNLAYVSIGDTLFGLPNMGFKSVHNLSKKHVRLMGRAKKARIL